MSNPFFGWWLKEIIFSTTQAIHINFKRFNRQLGFLKSRYQSICAFPIGYEFDEIMHSGLCPVEFNFLQSKLLRQLRAFLTDGLFNTFKNSFKSLWLKDFFFQY
ncbi:MAG: hypothetical protein R3A13_01385 [Bdellovibrionota bacterium]